MLNMNDVPLGACFRVSVDVFRVSRSDPGVEVERLDEADVEAAALAVAGNVLLPQGRVFRPFVQSLRQAGEIFRSCYHRQAPGGGNTQPSTCVESPFQGIYLCWSPFTDAEHGQGSVHGCALRHTYGREAARIWG